MGTIEMKRNETMRETSSKIKSKYYVMVKLNIVYIYICII